MILSSQSTCCGSSGDMGRPVVACSHLCHHDFLKERPTSKAMMFCKHEERRDTACSSHIHNRYRQKAKEINTAWTVYMVHLPCIHIHCAGSPSIQLFLQLYLINQQLYNSKFISLEKRGRCVCINRRANTIIICNIVINTTDNRRLQKYFVCIYV